MARYGCKTAIYQLLFFGSLPNSHTASGYIWGHNFWTNQNFACEAPQNDRLNLSFETDEHTYGKKVARNSHTTVIYMRDIHFEIEFRNRTVERTSPSCELYGTAWAKVELLGQYFGSFFCYLHILYVLHTYIHMYYTLSSWQEGDQVTVPPCTVHCTVGLNKSYDDSEKRITHKSN